MTHNRSRRRSRPVGTGGSGSRVVPWNERSRAIEAWLHAGTGLFLGVDFDGTLAPIAEDPDAPRITPANHWGLHALAARPNTRVVVVSGRALADLRSRVGVAGITYAGNHGLELQIAGSTVVHPVATRYRTTVLRVRDRLGDRLAAVPGCEIEDKGLTLSVHVRRTPRERVPGVRNAVSETIAAASKPLCTVEGKQVFDIRPDVAWDKGSAMEHLSTDVPSGWRVAYIGDDTTDEDAFRRIGQDGMGLVVGSRTDTAADFQIPTQQGVARFLGWLATVPSRGTE